MGVRVCARANISSSFKSIYFIIADACGAQKCETASRTTHSLPSRARGGEKKTEVTNEKLQNKTSISLICIQISP